ncbi:MAG: TetR family transcriptional regulator [Propionibacteriaceae bacterium]|nr:TetR family transcriptional regulator [Propionibacteriaceae bacterium]
MALSRQAIVDAGLAILDEYGLGDLSMRRVADSLGVQAGALYYHVPNKQSLLAAIADEVLAPLGDEVTAPLNELAQLVPERAAPEERGPRDDEGPPNHLRAWAHDLRRALLKHRDAAELVASAHALGLGTVDPTAAGRQLLVNSGHPEPDATMAALLHFVLGHVVEEQTQAQMQALGVVAHFDADVSAHHFAVGVDIFVRGATVR